MQKVQYNGNVAPKERPEGALGGFGRVFMAIMAIKLRKKVNWRQLSMASIAGQSSVTPFCLAR